MAVGVLLVSWFSAAAGQEAQTGAVQEAEDRIQALSETTAAISVASGEEVFDDLRDAIGRERQAAVACVTKADAAIARLKKEREVLAPVGAAPPVEGATEQGAAAETSREGRELVAPVAELTALEQRRKALKTNLAEQEERQALCRLLVLRTDELLERVNEVEKQKLARRLLARGPHVLEVVSANIQHPEPWWGFTTELAHRASGADRLPPTALLGMLAMGVLGLVGGMLVRHRYQAAVAGAGAPPATTLGGLWLSLRVCSLRFAPILLTLTAVSAYLTLHGVAGGGPAFVSYLAYALLALAVASRLTRVAFKPCSPVQAQVLGLSDEVAHPLNQRLQVLWVVIAVGGLMFYTPMEEVFHPDGYLLARDIYMAFLVANTVWVIWLARRLEFLRAHWVARTILVVGFAAILAAELLGYRNLAGMVVRSALLTLAALGGQLLLLKIVEDASDTLDEGQGPVAASLRRRLGLSAGEYVPGLGWLRLVAILSLWLAFLALLLEVWGLSDEGFRVIYRNIAEGFQVGSFQVVPGHLLGAVVAFALMLTFTGWIKSQMDQRWLAKVRMDRGAKEALVTTSGYVGVALAVLVGLSVAGLELTNLALIAGALSVGIGFGLQNVVNNFVSGLILLMERPIRTGDWIVVGNTQGYVRRISIRSTRIQTFDRADVIVPNSEIISNQVTNWMLTDPYGRLKLPVGVAYGSDVAKVQEVILEAALEHPMVVHGLTGLMEPKVMFMGFGDSSLNFELWCMLREVDMRLTVQSDLYYTLERRFREEGVEIPFPQRDLHVRTGSPPPRPSEGTPEA